jgi:hypothetical protein
MKKFIDESWLVLTMGIVFACLLAGTHTGLNSTIMANQTAALNEAIARSCRTRRRPRSTR